MNIHVENKSANGKTTRRCSLCSSSRTNEEAGRSATLGLRIKAYQPSILGLTIAAEKGCQDCGLVLDAVAAWYDGQSMDSSRQFRFHISSSRLTIYSTEEPGGGTGAVEVVYSPQYPAMVDQTPANNIWKLPEIQILSGSTSADPTFRYLADLMRNCEKYHKTCSRPFANLLPKRILEIRTGKVYLREPQKVSARYACLSHCWGPLGPATRLTKASLGSLSKGIAICVLPKTFRDAVVVCQSLGISYLWIDALCIVQDSPEDWEEAANTMADVYENACITIAAASAADSTEGLFSPDRVARRLTKHSQFYVKPYIPELSPHYTILFSNNPLWPLFGRAWVYQERRLSPRIVYFSMDQVYWECKHMFTSEDNRRIKVWKSDPLSEWRTWTKDPARSWQEIIQEYSTLKLTYEKDRLPAIAAVAYRMSLLREPGDVYLAGMWKNSISYDWCWYCIRPPGPRPARTFPSWSWASTQGSPIWFNTKWQQCNMEVLSLSYNIVGRTYLGTVRDCRLVVRGHILPLTKMRGISHKDICDIHRGTPARPKFMFKAFRTLLKSHRLYCKFWGFYPDYDLKTATSPFESGTRLKLMLFAKLPDQIGGVVLRQLSEASDEHERIGFIFARIAKKDKRSLETDQMLQSVPIEDVLIV